MTFSIIGEMRADVTGMVRGYGFGHSYMASGLSSWDQGDQFRSGDLKIVVTFTQADAKFSFNLNQTILLSNGCTMSVAADTGNLYRATLLCDEFLVARGVANPYLSCTLDDAAHGFNSVTAFFCFELNLTNYFTHGIVTGMDMGFHNATTVNGSYVFSYRFGGAGFSLAPFPLNVAF